MLIFTDESGDFYLKKIPNFSLIASIICVDSFHDHLCYYLQKFREKNGYNDEAKGSRISGQQRLAICDFINKNKQYLRISLIIADSQQLSSEQLHAFRDRQADAFIESRAYYIRNSGESQSPEMLAYFDRLIKIAQYSTRLSDEEFLQAVMTFQQIKDVLQYSIAYFIDRKFARSFVDYHFIFDRKLPNTLSSMEKYIEANLVTFLHGASKTGHWKPLTLPDIWKRSHPFVDKYVVGDGEVDIGAIFNHGLKFINSKDESGLQLTDIVAHTVYSCLFDSSDELWSECYKLLRPAMGSVKDKCLTFIRLTGKNCPSMSYLKKTDMLFPCL